MVGLLRAPAIRFPDFRALSVAAVFNAAGMNGEIVVLGWVVLEATDSTFLVGITFAIRWVPMLLFGIPAGAIADRVSRNFLLKLLSIGLAAQSAALGVVLLFELEALWNIFIFTFLGGTLHTFYQATRQGFIPDIVGSENVVNGMAIATLAMRVGALIGSLVAGITIARLAPGVAMLILAGLYGLSGISLMAIRRVAQQANSSNSVWGNLTEYFGEIRRNQTLLALMIITGAVEILGFSHMVLFPTLARDVLGIGVEGLGVLNAVRSIGGMIGVTVLSFMGPIRRTGLIFLLILPIFGGAVATLGVVSNYLAVLAVLLLINSMASMSDVFSQGLMQKSVPPALRGRAGGSWVFAIGTQPIGSIQIGALATGVGLTFAFVSNGLGLVVLATAIALAFPRLRSL